MRSRLALGSIGLVTLLGLTACAPTTGSAPGKDALTVSCFSSVYADVFEKHIIPGFEKAFDVDVEYIAQSSGPAIAQIKAQVDDPQIDVACVTGLDRVEAETSNLLEKVDPAIVTNAKDLRDYGFGDSEQTIDWSVFFVGLSYDKDAVAALGAAEPTSWNDLLDPAFAGQSAFSEFVLYGQLTLQMMAEANGGGLDDIDPGFEALSELSQSGAVITGTDFTQLYSQKEIAIAPWSNSSLLTTVESTGLPLGFVFPEEGTAVYPASMGAVKNSSQGELAQEFLNYMLTPDVQKLMATELNLCPAVDGLDLPADVTEAVGYAGFDQRKYVSTDFSVWADKGEEWRTRWNEEIQN